MSLARYTMCCFLDYFFFLLSVHSSLKKTGLCTRMYASSLDNILHAVARRFEKKYGCMRLSIGEALRRVITLFPDTKLTQVILSHLKTGQAVPDDLCVYALERALLDIQCQTRG